MESVTRPSRAAAKSERGTLRRDDPSPASLAASVSPAVNLKNRLRNIETDCRDRLHVAPSESWSPIGSHFLGASAPVEEPSTTSIAVELAGLKRMRAISATGRLQTFPAKMAWSAAEGRAEMHFKSEV